MPQTTKNCSLCKIDKLHTDFHKNKYMKDGYQHRCKVCMKIATVKYLSQPDKLRKRTEYNKVKWQRESSIGVAQKRFSDWLSINSEYRKEYKKNRRSDPDIHKKELEYKKLYRIANPMKHKIWKMKRRALKKKEKS